MTAASELSALIEGLDARIRAEADWGDVAAYIPELAQIDPAQFGIFICLADGTELSAGQADQKFSIQSVSKVFTLALALGRYGEALWRRVGREPLDDPFNSMIQLENEGGIPRNPFINAGAIVTTDALLSGHTPKDTLAELLTFLRGAAEDQDIFIDHLVARSEQETGHRNFAIAHFLKSFGNLEHEPALSLGTYFHQCAIAMNCRQLARAGRFLCKGFDGAQLLRPNRVRSVNALMMTCGHYDGSGDFAFRVGVPGKSGVGGGILAVVPKIASIAVWSPGLNEYGNSKQGTRALEDLSRAMGWSVFV